MKSIQSVGLLHPIIVRPVGDSLEIVAGERRFEACRRLHWKNIPCIVHNFSDKDSFEVALSENIERETLNPIEEAIAFKRYIQEFGWGGESDLAKRIGKSQQYVSQRLKLLDLPKAVLDLVTRRQVNPSVASELIWAKDEGAQKHIAQMASLLKLTQREVRDLVRSIRKAVVVDNRSVSEENITNADMVHNGKSFSSSIANMNTSETAFPIAVSIKLNESKDKRAIERALLTLKIALFRIDSILNEGIEDQQLRKLMLATRVQLHDMADPLIKFKMKCKWNNYSY